MSSGGILALDIATTTGFCFGQIGAQPPQLKWGSRDFGSGRSNGEIVATWRAWVNQRCYDLHPRLVVMESPYVPVGGKAGGGPPMNPLVLRRLLGMTATVEAVCFELHIPCREVVSAAFTKFVTGKGRYKTRDEKKAAVMDACRRLGCECADDNQSDAVAIYFFAEALISPRAADERRRLGADRDRVLHGAGPLFATEKEIASQGPILRGDVQPQRRPIQWSKLRTEM